jgi:hypothetical protein
LTTVIGVLEDEEWNWIGVRVLSGISHVKNIGGEYAAHDRGRQATLRSALAEAAYLTHLERNADVVRLASFAPLLARRGHIQWHPDLIYFDKTAVYPTVNYYVQQRPEL